MNHRIVKLSAILSVMILVSLACGFGSKKSTEEMEPNEPVQEENNISGEDNDILGEEFRSEVGGFSIRKVKGYGFNDVFGIIAMNAPDANQEVGPGLTIFGGITEGEVEYTNETMLEKFKTESTAIEVGGSKKIKVNNIPGLLVDIGGKYDDQPIKGQLVIVMVNPTQQFNILAIAPEPRWDELKPKFDAVLRSAEFFEPDPDAVSDEPELSSEPTISENPSNASYQDGDTIRQWATSAVASSEYGSSDWAAHQATGEPNVDDCNDNVNAWASASSNTLEWLELTYDVPVVPSEINIYQSYNPSQVVEVQVIDTEGATYTIWTGEPEETTYCPDLMTITIELDYEIIVNKVVVVVDQSILGLGWVEIDAVELVGTARGSTQVSSSQSDVPVPSSGGGDVPDNYSGWMADDLYQGYIQVKINKTNVSELDQLLGTPGKKSTDSWKPRPDHANTFLWDLGKDNKIYIGVLTDGTVYKKSISPQFVPQDFQLDTVNKTNYQKLDDMYAKTLAIAYVDMANLLKSPGFLREAYTADGKIKEQYEWYAPNGDHIGGFFIDGKLTGIAGLVYIQK